MNDVVDSGTGAAADTAATSADTGAADTSVGAGERVTTNSIAASVLDDLEHESPDAASTEATAQAADTAKVVEELSEVAKFMQSKGHKPKRADGRDSWFPYPVVEKLLDSYTGQHRTNWDTRYTALESERNTLKSEFDRIAELGELMERDPRAFLERVAQHDERYKSFLTPQQIAQQAAEAKMPDPDIPLQDGSRTYSLKAIQEQLVPWIVQQAKAEARAEAEARLKPLTEREKQAEERQKTDAAEQQVRERAQTQLKEAESWPYFGKYDPANLNEVQTAILKEMRADKTISLHSAYMKVVKDRFAEDDNKRRERLLKEIQGAPKSPTIARAGGGVPKVASGPKATRDIAAETYDAAARS